MVGAVGPQNMMAGVEAMKGKRDMAIGQQAKLAVAEAKAAGADLPKNAQGVAASSIAKGADPASVFAGLTAPQVPVDEQPVADAPDTAVADAPDTAVADAPDTAVTVAAKTADTSPIVSEMPPEGAVTDAETAADPVGVSSVATSAPSNQTAALTVDSAEIALDLLDGETQSQS